MMGSTNRSSSWLNWAQAPREQGGLGLAPHQAAGIVGNLVHESGQELSPWGPTGDNGTAWGTAQWRGDRLARLKQRPDYQTVEGQQAFMREELDGSENKAYRALQAAKTPEEAAHAWDANYERSDGSTREQRMRSARDLMSQFGGDTTYQPDATTSSFAPTESKKSMPALSADNTLGQGILASDYEPNYANSIGQALTGVGASIAGISNPDQAKVLAAQAAGMQKATVDKGTWTMHVLPNGQVVRINNKTGMPQTLGNAAKPEKDTYTEEAQKASAKSNQDLGDQINQNARDSSALGQTVTEIRSAMQGANSPDQGIFGPARQSLAKAYTGLGFGDADLAAKAANGDIGSALSNKLALQLVNSGGVKLLPGSFSDSDRKFVAAMATSLSNSPEANARLLDIYERSNKYVQQAEELRAAHAASNEGIIRPGFRKELSDLSQRQLEEAKAEAAARASAPAASTSAPLQPGSVHVWTPGKGIRPK
jgi:hypothetical protein